MIRQKKLQDIEILGPVPAPLVKIKDRVRWHLLLKGKKPSSLHNLCYLLQEQWKSLCSGKVKVSIDVDPESIFDIHVKRIHEYKRQLLNVMNVIHTYIQVKEGKKYLACPRTFIFAGKAAPGYSGRTCRCW